MAELEIYLPEELADCEKSYEDSDNYCKALRFADDNLREILVGYIDRINTRNWDKRYGMAVEKMNSASDEKDFKAAAELLEEIPPEYKDVSELLDKCLAEAEECRNIAIYESAMNAMKKANGKEKELWLFEKAMKGFQSISGYRDADEQFLICEKKYYEYRREAVYQSAMRRRVSAEALDDISSYKTAMQDFQSISGWKDADEQIVKCQEKIAKIERKDNFSIAKLIFIIILVIVALVLIFSLF